MSAKRSERIYAFSKLTIKPKWSEATPPYTREVKMTVTADYLIGREDK